MPHRPPTPHSNIRALHRWLGLCLLGLSAAASALPNWVSQPPADTDSTLYGVGEAEDLAAARRAALRDIASKLRVSISATADSRLTVSNDTVDRFSQSKVNEEVRKTEFSRHRLEKSETEGGLTYALVAVDRQEFVADSKARLDALDRDVDRGLNALKGAQGLDRLKHTGPLKASAEAGLDLLALLSAADRSFRRDAYSRKFETAARLDADARRDLVFRLQYKPVDEDIANLLRELLSNAGFSVQEHATPGAALLVIGGEAKEQTVYGSALLRLKIDLSLRSDKGGVFAQKAWNTDGSSAADRGIARQNALRKLAGQWKGKSALAVLGLETP